MTKDNRPPKHLRTLKRGDVRDDGMLFWGYCKTSTNGEWWMNPKQYESKLKKRKASQREYFKKNKVKLSENQKTWVSKNREHLKEYYRNYDKKNANRRRKTKAAYQKKRRQSDDSFRISSNLRRRIALAMDGQCRSSSVSDLLGCSIQELKEFLESKFLDGMSWENYGLHGWHIDHIKPCAAFDLTLDEEQKKCFHYTNLQPLWAEDNLRKSDHYE